MKRVLLFLIDLYQRTLSPDHGWFRVFYPAGYCRFRPTCSEYCSDAITKYSLWRGLLKSVWRILRCNPWSKGGYDPA